METVELCLELLWNLGKLLDPVSLALFVCSARSPARRGRMPVGKESKNDLIFLTLFVRQYN